MTLTKVLLVLTVVACGLVSALLAPFYDIGLVAALTQFLLGGITGLAIGAFEK